MWAIPLGIFLTICRKSTEVLATCVLKSSALSGKALAGLLELTGVLDLREAGEPLSRRNPASARLDHCVLKLREEGVGETVDAAVCSLIAQLGDLAPRIMQLPEGVLREVFVLLAHNGSGTGMLVDVSLSTLESLAKIRADLRLDIWVDQATATD